MKAALVMLILISTNAYADDDFVGPPAPYPEVVAVEDYPAVAHWQLTMVRQYALVDIDTPGFEFMSRKSCMADGMRRILEEDESAPDFIPAAERWLGFICEYVTP